MTGLCLASGDEAEGRQDTVNEGRENGGGGEVGRILELGGVGGWRGQWSVNVGGEVSEVVVA